MSRLLSLVLVLLLAFGGAVAQQQGSVIPSTVITGPASATSGNCASFSGTTGKIIQDAGTTCGGSSGAMALISTATANNTSGALQFTGLGSSYNSYLLDCNGIQPASSTIGLIQVGTGGTPTWATTNYTNSGQEINAGTPSAVFNTTGGGIDVFGVITQSGTATATPYALKAWVHNIASATVDKMVIYQSFGVNTTPAPQSNVGGGYWNAATTAVTAIRLMMTAGNIVLGQCSLYGITP